MKVTLTSVVALCAMCLSGLGACGSSSDTTADASQAAQQSDSAASDAGNADASTAGHSPTSALFAALSYLDRETVLGTSFNDTFKVGGCTAAITGTLSPTGSTAVELAATITYTAAQCTGKMQLAGNENITATLSDTNRTLNVVDNLTRTYASGDSVTISSLDSSKPYTYSASAQGLPANGNVTLDILLNEHRVRSTNKKVVFDHNITTPFDPIVVVNSFSTSGGVTKASTRTIVSGDVELHHNLAKFLSTHSFSNVVHDLTGSCLCPQSGQMQQVVLADDKSYTYTRTYTFTGCGTATVVTSSSTKSDVAEGSTTETWDNCSG